MTKDEALDLALEALEVAQDNLRPHGDNCFLHDEGEYNRCFCGKDSLSDYLQDAVEKLDAAIKQARALDKMAENARELGLDYEPAGGTQVSKVWWDGEKLMAKPIPLEDIYQPAPVQEPVAYRSRMRNRDGQVITGWVVHTDTSENPDPRIEIEPLYTTPPAAPVQEPVSNASAWFALVMNAAAELEDASHCLRDEDAKRVAISGAKHYRDAAKALYTTPPAAQRQWVGLTPDDLPLPLYEYSPDFQVGMQWAEAKLKEKNT